jgi:Reverse transcriptase (RNA-dependent DNA polymerase)
VAAFLNEQVKGDVYIKMPIGFKRPDIIYKLKKALYGLKASPVI